MPDGQMVFEKEKICVDMIVMNNSFYLFLRSSVQHKICWAMKITSTSYFKLFIGLHDDLALGYPPIGLSTAVPLITLVC
jgi:hypothetical protein